MSKSEQNIILARVAKHEITPEQAAALLGNGKGNGKLSCKVADKGGVSVYGLGRWPVTLYKGQWARLIAFVGEVEQFIADHPELKDKE